MKKRLLGLQWDENIATIYIYFFFSREGGISVDSHYDMAIRFRSYPLATRIIRLAVGQRGVAI